MTVRVRIAEHRDTEALLAATLASPLAGIPGAPMLLCLLAAIETGNRTLIGSWDAVTHDFAVAEAVARGLVITNPLTVTREGRDWAHEHLAPFAPLIFAPEEIEVIETSRRGRRK